MKVNRMISFTFCNGLILLAFAFTLASCQKSSIKTSGHFSAFNSYRSIASTLKENEFDPKQIYIFCTINAVNVDACYNKKIKKLSVKTIKSLPAIKIEVTNITEKIVNSLRPDIDKNVLARKSFCLINSKYHFRKCLTQYIDRDSMVTLNKYHKNTPEITGYEYLHLKRSLANIYSKKLKLVFKEKFQNHKSPASL